MKSLKHWHRDWILMVILADRATVEFKSVEWRSLP